MTTSSEDTIALLSRVPVFSTLSREDLAHVAQVAMPRQFAAGEAVFREGDEGSTCYIVRAGRARAIRENPDGRSITLAHFGPGDIFGEMAMLDGERRSATVEATEDTEAIAILSSDMHRLLHEQEAEIHQRAAELQHRAAELQHEHAEEHRAREG